MLDKLVVGILAVYVANLLWRFFYFMVDLEYKKRLVKGIPGPEIRPIVGCMHKLPKKKSDFPAFFLEESRKALDQGRSVMKIWFGSRLVIYPLDSESTKVIMQSNVELKKGDTYHFLSRWLGNGLITGNGEHWHKSRRVLTPVFHFAKLDEYSHAIDYHSRRFVQYLMPKADGKSIVNLYEPIKRSALDIIADAGMGVELDSIKKSDQPYPQAVEKFANLSFMRINYFYMSFNWLWSLLGHEQETKDTLKVLKDLTTWIIQERMKILKEDGLQLEKKKPNFLDLLLELHMKGELSLEEVREQVDTFMFAGHDTTSHSLSWTIWCLATHPEIQERVYREINKTFGDSCSDFEWTKIQELRYLRAVIKESLRLFPSVPMIERSLINEVEMDGFTLPRGAFIKISPFLLHHNHKVFPDHWKFNPDNFYEDQKIPAHAYIPFASGPRNCIGQRFAQREMQTMICHMVYNFEFSTDKRLEDNGMEFSLILRPTLGVPVTMRRRQN